MYKLKGLVQSTIASKTTMQSANECKVRIRLTFEMCYLVKKIMSFIIKIITSIQITILNGFNAVHRCHFVHLMLIHGFLKKKTTKI